LVEGRVLHVDATTIRADIDRERVNKPDSSDPDARFGRFPRQKIEPGYKQHTVADGKARVVLGVSVTPADRSEHDEAVAVVDEALKRLKEPPEAVCADAAYASGKNARAMESRGIRLVSPPPKPKTYTGDEFFSIEDFEYDEKNDRFTCPAEKQLKYTTTEKKRGRRTYRALHTDCSHCSLKPCCTNSERRHLKVSRHHASLVRLRADSKTESFRNLYRARAPVIEGVFAEAKQWHSLGRAWRRGLSKMLVQSLLVAAIINFKRLMMTSVPLLALFFAFRSLISQIRSYMGIAQRGSHDSPSLKAAFG
jgi:hypothetical protein